MKPPEAQPRRWMVIVLQVAVSVATFAAGWYVAVRAVNNSPTSLIKTAAAHNTTSGPLSADDLAKAKADLARILKTAGRVRRDHAMLDFIAGLDADTVKDLLTDLETKPSTSSDSYEAIDDLIARLTELDPKAALDWAQTLNDPQKKSSGIRQVFQAWAAQDPAAALAALRSLPPGLQSGASRNPGQPAGLILPGQESGAIYADVFRAWAGNNPAAAAAGALDLPPSAMRNQSLKGVASAWAQQDPTGALAWANALPPSSGRQDAVYAAIQGMSSQDPQAAADNVAKLPADKSRDTLIEDIARTWTVHDPTAALDWAEKSLIGSAHDTAVQAAFSQLSYDEPATAAAYLVANPGVVNANDTLSMFELAYSWAGQDSQAALNWALALPASNTTDSPASLSVRQEVLSSVLYTWSNNDPVGAAAYIQNHTDDPDFGKLARGVAISWADTDPQAAITWAKSLPASDAQNETLLGVVSSIARSDPQTAMTEAQQLTGNTHDQAVATAISAMATQQPSDAAAALQNLPVGKNLDGATASVASIWLRLDPAAASQWVDTLPQGTARDGAVTQLVATVGQNDPASAFNWAVSIGNVSTRNTQVVKLATQWAAKDPDAAAAAAQNALTLTNLSAAQRTSLQKIATGTSNP